MSVNPDEVEQEFEDHKKFVQDLLVRVNQQGKDINEAIEELDRLSDSIEENTISPEEWNERLASGVAQS